MINIMKINDNIHKINTPYKDIFTTVCTVKTDEGVLIFDAASFDNDVEDYILPMLKELEISAEDIKYIFISHNHKDHAGALRKLLEYMPDVTVLSRCDKLKESYCDYNVVAPDDGDSVLGVLKVVTIPGHTHDSMAILDTRTSALITGDCLQVYGIFGSQDWGSNIGFPAEHLEAVEKVRKMNVNEIYTAHDYHPVGVCACGTDEVSSLLDGCVEPIMKVKSLIVENPEKDDAEIRLMYNSSDDIPPITTRLVETTRKALNDGRL